MAYVTVGERDERSIKAAIDALLSGESWAPDGAHVDVSLGAREIYSYGRHFPLFRFIPRKVSGRAPLFVLNGDEWRGGSSWGNPSATPGHQETCRREVSARGISSIILPFSALNGAGLDIDSVRPIHVRDDSRWTEERTARTREEMPRHERIEHFQVTREASTFEAIPHKYASLWRDPTVEEIESGAVNHSWHQNLPRLADADGIYRWKENRTRDVAPDADGLFRWTVNVHRLGDALFSAIRAESFTRAARPFETDKETARETVSLVSVDNPNGHIQRSYCDTNSNGRHETGPAASCIHCGRALLANVILRRRARYLSSFDTNESPSLYFLAQVPRGSGETVDSALESLAPRAVHAAIARGIETRRQGDIFFIDTPLTRAELERRGAVFARLTQFTRDARARKGEVNYRPAPTVADRRREARYARKVWRETFGAQVDRLTLRAAPDRSTGRAANRERWQDLKRRHGLERAAAIAAGADLEAPESSQCETCHAEIGAPCGTVTLETGRILDCSGIRHGYRRALTARHTRELEDLKRDTAARTYRIAAPESARGARRHWQVERARRAAAVETARRELERTLGAPARIERPARYGYSYYYGAASSVHRESRRRYAESVKRARETLNEAIRREAIARNGRIMARDGYRTFYGTNAQTLHFRALETARAKHRPAEYDSAGIRRRRENARRILAVYGTAHSATLVARVNGAVYVSGTVRHIPELESGRGGVADHRPLTLTAGRWYLAVRNTVPRQNRRRA